MGALLLLIADTAMPQNPKAPSAQEISRRIVSTATNYAKSISCADVKINPKFVVTLNQWKTMDDRFDARYAVLWYGDIGCGGGSQSTTLNILIATVGAGNTVVVDPTQSSPVATFEASDLFIEKVVSNSKDSLLLEGKEAGPNDANCCPSVLVQTRLRADPKGNWKVIEKKTIAKKK